MALKCNFDTSVQSCVFTHLFISLPFLSLGAVWCDLKDPIFSLQYFYYYLPLQIVKLNRFAIVRYHFENFDYFEHKELFSEKFGVKDDFVSLAIT